MFNIFLQISNGTVISLPQFTFIDSNVLVQIALVAVTSILVLVTWRKMKESNKLMRIEIESKLRPWISLGETKPTQIVFSDNSVVSYEKWAENTSNYKIDIIEIKIGMQVKNSGTIPARNVRKKVASSHNELSRNSFNSIPFEELSVTVMPGESHKSNWHIPWEDWRRRLENPLYLGVLIEYDVSDNKKEETGLIVNMGHSGSNLVDAW